MTLEQLQAMSDTELNELAAVKVMGKLYQNGKMWDELEGRPGHRLIGEWNPTVNMNDAFELLRALGKLGILYRIKFSEIISKTFTASTGELAIWPNAIFLLEPKHITIASILAKEE